MSHADAVLRAFYDEFNRRFIALPDPAINITDAPIDSFGIAYYNGRINGVPQFSVRADYTIDKLTSAHEIVGHCLSDVLDDNDPLYKEGLWSARNLKLYGPDSYAEAMYEWNRAGVPYNTMQGWMSYPDEILAECSKVAALWVIDGRTDVTEKTDNWGVPFDHEAVAFYLLNKSGGNMLTDADKQFIRDENSKTKSDILAAVKDYNPLIHVGRRIIRSIKFNMSRDPGTAYADDSTPTT